MGLILTLEEAQALPPGQMRDWAYNALDVTGTREVWDALDPRLDEQTRRTYAFERAVQAPALSMMRRGILIDVEKRKEIVKELRKELKAVEKQISKRPDVVRVWDRMEKETGNCRKATRKDGKHKWAKWEKGVSEVGRICVDCGKPRLKPKAFNAGSDHDKNHLFYELFGLPEMKNKKKIVSTDKETLKRLQATEKAKPYYDLIEDILKAQDLDKQIQYLSAKVGPDGRYYSTVNVGAAWTGRFSTSKSPFGMGGNIQNIAERARHIFMADPGMEMCYADLKTAESNVVAHLAQDEGYIEAHASGDVHTFVTRLLWPDLPWTGDLKKDKKIANQNPDWDLAPGHGFRFQAKRIQHGSNYGLTPFGIAMIAKIPLEEAKRAYHMYFAAFPRIKTWQQSVGTMVANQEPLINPLGRRVRLFGRPWDGHTLKQGLAFLPQSTVADIINMALWRIWRYMGDTVQMLAQVHDALLFQYPRGMMDTVLPQAMELMTIPVDINSRTLIIPTEAAVGLNWGKRHPEKNPFGMEEVNV